MKIRRSKLRLFNKAMLHRAHGRIIDRAEQSELSRSADIPIPKNWFTAIVAFVVGITGVIILMILGVAQALLRRKGIREKYRLKRQELRHKMKRPD